MNSEHVILAVGQGDEPKSFSVPKGLLCGRSSWFKNALKADRFVEGRTKEIQLPEDGPDIVEAFIYFLYNRSLAFDDTNPVDDDTCGAELKFCSRFWAFADKYLLPKLQNVAILRACSFLRQSDHIAADTLAQCFRTTGDGSLIRILVADYCVRQAEVRGNEFDVGEKLGGCPGFMAALHDSEAAFHTMPASDFPRYLKPAKLAVFLYKDGEDGEDETFVPWQWDQKKPDVVCSECRQISYEEDIICRMCKMEKCDCEKPDLGFLCWRCRL